MCKICIFFRRSNLNSSGGPTGYLYNLQKGLDKIIKKCDVHYLDDFILTDGNGNKVVWYQIKNRLIRDIFRYIKYSNIDKIKGIEFSEKLLNYDVIHFHSIYDLYTNRKWINNYKGIVVLTSHSPCAYHQELLSRINYNIFKNKIIKLKLEKAEEYAFERAGYVIFPCCEAKEPYFSTWNKFIEIDKKIEEKYRYLLTGIEKCNEKRDKTEIRNELRIPSDKLVICYVGRHNEIKGYGKLKEIAMRVWSIYPDIFFLIAGKEEPIKGIEDSRWIEIGWTNDPHSYIKASDFFILPNLETYFDLILLEVLSLGKMVLLSDTGGNKYFKRYNSNGIKFFSNTQEAIKGICEYKKYSLEERILAEKENLSIYNRDFTCEKFAKEYLKLVCELVKDRKSEKKRRDENGI